MSHVPREICEHVWSSWTTAEAKNEAGDSMFVFQRCCFSCGIVDSEQGAIIEPTEMRYTRTLEAGSEPDD